MIKCARTECKYNSRINTCKCKNLVLSYWSVMTKNMGRKEFLECKSFEESDKFKKLKKELIELGILNNEE